MLVTLDANAWISERLLRSATGAAFLHAVHTQHHRVLLPAVTREEVTNCVERLGLEAAARVEESLRTIQTYTGSRREYSLPSGKEFRECVGARIKDFGDLVHEVAITPSHHEKALDRVQRRRPPAANKEQYRDCLLWEALIEHREGDNALISADGDFAPKGSKGKLDERLREETAGTVSLFRSLREFMVHECSSSAPVRIDEIANLIAVRLTEPLSELARKYGFALGSLKSRRLDFFATERPKQTAVPFTLTWTVTGLRLPDQTVVAEAELDATGECFLDLNTRTIHDITMHAMSAYDPSRARVAFGITYLAASFGNGPAVLPYKVRAQLGARDDASDVQFGITSK
jgi:hypothetical protein